MSDSVNNPPHYKQGEVETIDGIRAALGESFVDYCRGNVLKYVWRCGKKGDAIEDLRKAAKYLQWAIDAMETNSSEVPNSSAGKTLAIPEGWRELEENEPLSEDDLFDLDGEWVGHEYDPSGGVYSSRIHRRHIRKIETENPSESQSGNHVEGVWVEEAGEAEPTDSLPNPGPGYRLLSKDPPERVVKGDEFYLDGKWEESGNWGTNGLQAPSYYYRRKIEPTEWVPKVGDKVRVIKPDTTITGYIGTISRFDEVTYSVWVESQKLKLFNLEAKDLELIEAAQ